VGTMASTSTIDSPDNIAPSDSASCIGSRPEPSHPSQVASWAPYTVGAAPAPVPSVVTASQRGNRQSGGAIPLPPPSGDGAWPSMPVGGHPPVGLGLALDPAFEDVQLGPLTATPRLDNTAPRSLPATMSRFMAAHTPKAYVRPASRLWSPRDLWRLRTDPSRDRPRSRRCPPRSARPLHRSVIALQILTSRTPIAMSPPRLSCTTHPLTPAYPTSR
jgi:hypothetical protein